MRPRPQGEPQEVASQLFGPAPRAKTKPDEVSPQTEALPGLAFLPHGMHIAEKDGCLN